MASRLEKAFEFEQRELPWFFIAILLFFAITVAAGDILIFGFQVSGLGWIGPLVFSLLMLGARRAKSAFPLLIWTPWIFVVVAYALLSSQENAWHRSLIMLTPLVVGRASGSYRLTEGQTRALIRALGAIVVIGLVAVLLKAAGDVFSAQRDVYAFPAESISAVFLFAVFAGLAAAGNRRLLPYAIFAAAIPVFTVNRAAIATCLYVVVFGFSAIRLKYRALLGIGGIVLALAAFQLESVQQKMFFSGEGTLADLSPSNPNLRTSGRQLVWDYLFERAIESPMFGHGANASEPEVENLTEGVIAHPHNDWLRIFFDYGLIGLGAFAFGLFSLLHRVLRAMKASVGMDKTLFAAAATSLVCFAIMMITDNVIVYTAYLTSPLFLFVGALIGRSQAQATGVTTTAR
jgi:O-antigen ligase